MSVKNTRTIETAKENYLLGIVERYPLIVYALIQSIKIPLAQFYLHTAIEDNSKLLSVCKKFKTLKDCMRLTLRSIINLFRVECDSLLTLKP